MLDFAFRQSGNDGDFHAFLTGGGCEFARTRSWMDIIFIDELAGNGSGVTGHYVDQPLEIFRAAVEP